MPRLLSRHSDKRSDRSSSRHNSSRIHNSSSSQLEENANGHNQNSHKFPIELKIRMESPPLILYGLPKDSTGALMSGIFDLEVKGEEPFGILSVYLVLSQTITCKKFHSISLADHQSSNPPLKKRTCELARWQVLDHQAYFPAAVHGYPFSHLIPGTVPATSDNAVFSVEYTLQAVVVPLDYPHQEVKVTRVVNIQRSILRGPDKSSVRVFPPTELTCTANIPNVIYPRSAFPLEIVLDGVANAGLNEHSGTVKNTTRWRMRKVNWKVTEVCKMRIIRRNERSETHPSEAVAMAPVTSPIYPRRDEALVTNSPRLIAAAQQAASIAQEFGSLDIGAREGTGRPTSATNNERPAEGVQYHNQDASNEGNHIHPASSSHSSEGLSPHFSTAQGSMSIANNGNSSSNTEIASASNGSLNSSSKPTGLGDGADIITDDKVLAHGELKSGWKSDFSGKGRVELGNYVIDLAKIASPVTCNIDDPTMGLHVSHFLAVELVIVEETRPVNGRLATTATGSARILRMQFNLQVLERSGLGISWDDEVPPTYENIPLSPPEYATVSDLPTVECCTPSLSGVVSINGGALDSPALDGLSSNGNNPGGRGSPSLSALSPMHAALRSPSISSSIDQRLGAESPPPFER